MTPPPAATQIAPSGPVRLVPTPQPVTTTERLSPLLNARTWSRMRFLVDALVLYLASCAALFPNSAIRSVTSNHVLAALYPLVVLGMLHARRSPDDRLFGSLIDTAANVLGVISLSVMLLIAVEAMLGALHPLGLALRLWVFSFFYLGIARAVLLSVRRQAVRTDAFAAPTLIVGAGAVGEHLVERLQGDRRYGLRPVGFLDDNPLPRLNNGDDLGVPVLGGPRNLARAIEQTNARQVILAFSTEPDSLLVDQVRECQALGVEVALVPRLYEAINDRSTLDHVGGLPLLTLRPTDPRGWQFALKHAFDRGFAALALVLLSPLMLAIAAAVKLTSPGPVFFRQRRVGRDGHEFDLLKFRTMRVDVELGPGFQLRQGLAPGGVEGADRRTPVGRRLREFSLDELPQFINVLRGDMSVVGPRPERPQFVERFTEEITRYDDRHRVKSGITGWAQVSGLRGQTSIADRVEWDNWYIQNWSLRLDVRIIVLTVLEIWRRGG